jgi:hypothetical protein
VAPRDGVADREMMRCCWTARRVRGGRYLMRLGVQRAEGGFLFEVTHRDLFVVPSRAVSRDTV